MAMSMALSLSSTAATTLVRRCLSSTLSRRGARLSTGSPSITGIHYNHTSRDATRHNHSHNALVRAFSAAPPPPAAAPPPADAFQPPASLAPEAGLGAQDAMKLFVEHGLGKQKLQRIAADKAAAPLVDRWQRMVAAYLETQCHVISLLGYAPDERGIRLYTAQLGAALRLAPPDVQERLRAGGRDTYRLVLAAAFDLPSLLEEQQDKGELGIVEARNIMHKVSLRMQDPAVLEKVAKQCSAAAAADDSLEARQLELARKHTIVQEAMVTDVYLAEEGEPRVSLVEECGFGPGEDGYVRMQSVLAEYQGDPLINQYVGAAMTKLLRSAGIDMEAAREFGTA